MEASGKSTSRWLPRSFLERVGAALAAPRSALAAAESELSPGKTGTDAALLIALSVVAIYTRELVAAGWLGFADGLGVTLVLLVDALGDAVMIDLVFLCAAGIGLTVAAGSRRSLGRDFDLACVAFVPFAAVQLLAGLGLRLAGGGGAVVRHAITAIAVAWALKVLLLAHRVTRGRGAAR